MKWSTSETISSSTSEEHARLGCTRSGSTAPIIRGRAMTRRTPSPTSRHSSVGWRRAEEQREIPMAIKIYEYAGCSTCKKALKYLDAKKRKYEKVGIVEQPPRVSELKTMLGYL